MGRDDAEAMKWYFRAAKQGHAAAVAWCRWAAERGDARVQASFGAMFGNGLGVVQNYAEAMKWYRRAAKQGHAAAQHYIGVLYENGQGVARNYVAAYKWYSIAGVNGGEAGYKNRDILAEQMLPNQIAEALRLAQEWLANYGGK